LLFNLSFDRRSVNPLLQRLYLVQKDGVQSICSLLEGHLRCMAIAFLQLGNFAQDLPIITQIQKEVSSDSNAVRFSPAHGAGKAQQVRTHPNSTYWCIISIAYASSL